VISEWWNKIRFWNFDTFEKRMGALSTGLTVMGEVQTAVDKAVIDVETGNLLKTRILRKVDDLIGLGVFLDTEDEAERVDNRGLLIEKRDTKLLGTGRPSESADNPPNKEP
jgi:hypothetical protein